MSDMATHPNAALAGAFTAKEAWDFLQTHSTAVLVDVRSTAEWVFVGVPDVKPIGRTLVQLPWKEYPGMALNVDFVLGMEEQVADKNTPLLFMCRSGGRSHDAALAMAEAGYTACYNITDGFEGEPNAAGQRNTTGGWRQAELPWRQT